MTQLNHAVEYLAFSIFRGAVNLLPFRAAQRFGRGLGRAFYPLLPGRRAITLDNLRKAFPEKPERELESIARGAFENFGIAMCEMLSFGKLGEPELRWLLNFDEDPSPFRTLRSAGGVLIMTGHYGNWELAGYSVSPLAAQPLLLIVRTQANRLVDRVVNRLRTGSGNEVVPMERSVREVMNRLLSGRAVALAADQSATRESEYVPFFGREVATFRGPAVFALRTRAPVMIAFTVRRPDYTYDFVVERIPTDDLPDASDENVRELTRRHTAVLERYIRMRPDHWLWMHRRWKHLAPETVGEGGDAAAA